MSKSGGQKVLLSIWAGMLILCTRTVVISTIALLLASSCWADTLDIPLPELHGLYSDSGIMDRTASFNIPGNVTEIHGAWIVLAGNVNAGELVCDITGLDTTSAPLYFLTTVPDTSSGQTYGCEPVTPDVSGAFELTVEIVPVFGATGNLDFLLSGHGTIQCQGDPGAILGMCWLTIFPSATIDSATLRFDVDFAVANMNSTWGAIKGMYR